MKHTFRLLLLCVIALIVGISVSCMLESSKKSEGVSLPRYLFQEMRRSQALEQRKKEIAQAMQAKEAIIEDLIAKRRTLREAIDGFRQAEKLIEDQPGGLVPAYTRAETERELYQQILLQTRDRLRSDPHRAEEVKQRLEKEWAEQSRVEDEE